MSGCPLINRLNRNKQPHCPSFLVPVLSQRCCRNSRYCRRLPLPLGAIRQRQASACCTIAPRRNGQAALPNRSNSRTRYHRCPRPGCNPGRRRSSHTMPAGRPDRSGPRRRRRPNLQRDWTGSGSRRSRRCPGMAQVTARSASPSPSTSPAATQVGNWPVGYGNRCRIRAVPLVEQDR